MLSNKVSLYKKHVKGKIDILVFDKTKKHIKKTQNISKQQIALKQFFDINESVFSTSNNLGKKYFKQYFLNQNFA